MLRAKAVAGRAGWVTLASAVLVGPVLKKRQKTAKNRNAQAAGNGVCNTRSKRGNPTSIAVPETRKYEPVKRLRSQSPVIPPASVATSPAEAEIAPNLKLMCPRS